MIKTFEELFEEVKKLYPNAKIVECGFSRIHFGKNYLIKYRKNYPYKLFLFKNIPSIAKGNCFQKIYKLIKALKEMEETI